MIRKFGLIAVLALLVSVAFAQNQQTTGLATPVTTSQITLPVYTLNPAPASGANLAIVGNPGHQTIYYWISANYPVGKATLAGPFLIDQAPGTLSASRYVTINPTLPGGVTSYDVLKTSTPIQPSGACACAVATAVSPGAVTNDQSNSTSAYTVAPINVNALVMTIANEVQSSGVSHLILRQNGVQVADLSAAGGSIGGSGTATYIPLWSGSTALGNSNMQVVTSPNGVQYSLGSGLYWQIDASHLTWNSGVAGSGAVVIQNTYAPGANNNAGGIVVEGAPATGSACAGSAELLGAGTNGVGNGASVTAAGGCSNGFGATGANVYVTAGSTSASNGGGNVYLQPGTGGFGNGSVYISGLSAGCLNVNPSGVLASTGSNCGAALAEVAAGSVFASTSTSTPPAPQIKQIIDARDISGVDCTGATDSSTGLNALTNTQDTLSNKTLSFRGCPLVRLTSQWLIHAQEQLEIDLGGTWNTTNSAGNQGNTIIGGCAGAAAPIIQVSRSGNSHIHGGAIVAKAPGCSSSSFTGSIMYTNTASGGYTSTENKLSDTWLTTSNQGGAITGYYGVFINGTPNQEEFKMENVHIHCQNSPGSRGVYITDGNADSTNFNRGEINNCMWASDVEAGDLRITNSNLGSDGNYSVFGTGAAVLKGTIDQFSHNIVDTAGNMQIPSDAGKSGGLFEGNTFGASDLDPAHYYFETGGGEDSYAFVGSNTVNASATPLGSVLIGSTGYSSGYIYNLGGIYIRNNYAPTCCDFFNQSTTQGQFFNTGRIVPQNAISNLAIGGTSTDFALLPSANLGNYSRTSAPLHFQTDLVGSSGSPQGTPQNLDDYRIASVTKIDGSQSTLALSYKPASGGTAAGVFAVGMPFAGITTVAASTPDLYSVTPHGTTGSTTYTYVLVALTGCGTSAASSGTSTSTGNATLSGTNYNVLDFHALISTGAWGYAIYRTVGGSSQGFIATVPVNRGTYFANGDILFNDTGLPGDSSTPASTNTSGCINAPGGFVGNLTGNATNLSGTPTLPSGTVLPGYAALAASNTFVGNQTITGNLNVSGSINQTGGGPTQWSGNAQTGAVTVPGGSDFSLFVNSGDQLACQLSTALGGGSCLPSGSLPSGAANLVVATPNGSSGTASLRALVAADIPTLTPASVGACPASTTINSQTSSYALLLTDACAYVRMNVASANTVTVPLNASVAFPVGTTITVRQAGAGTTTVVATSGVTITTPSSLILRVQNSAVQLLKVATDTWDLMGDTQ